MNFKERIQKAIALIQQRLNQQSQNTTNFYNQDVEKLRILHELLKEQINENSNSTAR